MVIARKVFSHWLLPLVVATAAVFASTLGSAQEARADERIVFAANGIYLAKADGSECKKIVNNGPAADVSWLPNHQLLAYILVGGGMVRPTLHVVKLDGTGDRKLDNAERYSLSPTGNRFLYEFAMLPFAINVDGTGKVRYHNNVERSFTSPDGKLMLKMMVNGMSTNVKLLCNRADGTGKQVLFPSLSTRIDIRPLWSPDDKLVVVPTVLMPAPESGKGPTALAVASTTGTGKPRFLRTPGVDIGFLYIIGGTLIWAPDSIHLATPLGVLGNEKRAAIFVNLNGAGSVKAVPLPLKEGETIPYPLPTPSQPTLSPDGTHIAFLITALGKYKLAVVSIAGGYKQVAEMGTPPIIPSYCWSKDGTRLFFERTGENGKQDKIVAVKVDGSGEKELAEGKRPSVSPDGTRIAFWSTRDGKSGVYSLKVDGSGEPKLIGRPDSGVSESRLQAPLWLPR